MGTVRSLCEKHFTTGNETFDALEARLVNFTRVDFVVCLVVHWTGYDNPPNISIGPDMISHRTSISASKPRTAGMDAFKASINGATTVNWSYKFLL